MRGTVENFAFSLILLTFLRTIESVDYNTCASRILEKGTVCVCNAKYCDVAPPVILLGHTKYQLISTSKKNLGFFEKSGKFTNQTSQKLYINVPNFDVSKSAEIMGFGGAFTDATGLNIDKLSDDLQKILIESYFGRDGLEYTFGRVPIGGTDFSPRGYTNCDTQDDTLKSFELQKEDLLYKIKTIKAAQKATNKNLKLYASAWSAPAWMKTNNDLRGEGSLKPEYYELWAEFYNKWFTAYKEQGIKFWGVTVHNEGFTAYENINNMVWNFSTMNTWISHNFGPKIRNSEFKNLKIMLLDDNRYLMQGLQENTLNNESVIQYSDGIAVHWYSDNPDNQYQLDYTKSDLKDLFVLATEACTSINPLGSWDYANQYFTDIVIDLKHNLTGWVDWNMVLDTTGGPSWVNAALGAPILVNVTSNHEEFLKQPTYYVMGHFSKYVTPGSRRFNISESSEFSARNLTSIGFIRPDEKIVIIISNENDEEVSVGINFSSLKTSEVFAFEAHSINTLIYNK